MPENADYEQLVDQSKQLVAESQHLLELVHESELHVEALAERSRRLIAESYAELERLEYQLLPEDWSH